MSIPEDNLAQHIPIEGENVSKTEGEDELSLEKIEAEVNRRNKAKELENKPKKDPNTVDPLEIDPSEKEIPEVEQETVDPRFVGKTTEEIIEMYQNVETLQKSQTDELGELRKENKGFKEQKTQDESINLQEIEKKIMPEVKSWTPEKRAEWFKLFNKKPEEAMAQVVEVLVKPLKRIAAIDTNTREIKRLTELHKDDVVPYTAKDINALIAANKTWWKQYGDRIFEHAYDVIRNRDFDKNAAIRQKGINTKVEQEAAEENNEKNLTFVEGARPVKMTKTVKTITHDQIKAANPEEGMAVIRKELLKRGVKVDD